MKSWVIGLAAVASIGVAALLWCRRDREVSPAVIDARGANIERAAIDVAARCDPPGTFVEHAVQGVAAGIRCPDGTYLPPLNGVVATDPIPPIRREAFMPPIGAVVGKYTDAEGCAWWVTEDGSAFTTRWVTLRMPDGSMQRMVRTDQADSLGGDRFSIPLGR